MPETDVHRDMVRTVLNDLKTRGFQAIAAHLGEEEYPDTDRYVRISSDTWVQPDVQARSDQDFRLFVYEVETEESLESPGTREKLEVLTNAVLKSNGRFFLVVPEDLRDGAQRLLHDMNLDWVEVVGITDGRMV